eukprot:GHVO01005635.1.p1 GENE.GHVO01005635.1~~GHVO01005635.1.p1  ORF type:complete len:173 (+),score=69.03 GHVO01005635.1:145-663(+)
MTTEIKYPKPPSIPLPQLHPSSLSPPTKRELLKLLAPPTAVPPPPVLALICFYGSSNLYPPAMERNPNLREYALGELDRYCAAVDSLQGSGMGQECDGEMQQWRGHIRDIIQTATVDHPQGTTDPMRDPPNTNPPPPPPPPPPQPPPPRRPPPPSYPPSQPLICKRGEQGTL